MICPHGQRNKAAGGTRTALQLGHMTRRGVAAAAAAEDAAADAAAESTLDELCSGSSAAADAAAPAAVLFRLPILLLRARGEQQPFERSQESDAGGEKIERGFRLRADSGFTGVRVRLYFPGNRYTQV